jgi:hypothetical protein
MIRLAIASVELLDMPCWQWMRHFPPSVAAALTKLATRGKVGYKRSSKLSLAEIRRYWRLLGRKFENSTQVDNVCDAALPQSVKISGEEVS